MRLTVPRTVAGILVGLLGWYVFVGAPELASSGTPESAWSYVAPAPEAAAQAPHFPPVGRTFVGVQTRAGVEDFGDGERFAAATGAQPRVYEFSRGWAADEFDLLSFDKVAARGMLPMMSWEPWDFRAESTRDRERGEQPDFRLSRIIDGEFDPYLRSWAEGIAALRYPVALRLAHEMNGYWYPWCEQSNGNRAGEYVRMWRHVHDLFAAAGASNVIWAWSPDVDYDSATPLAGLYPGDDYVDWIGLSGYYGTGEDRTYRSFDAIFAPTLDDLATLSPRPVVITEVGATDADGRRTEWITDMFRSLPRYPEIVGVIWFEATREIDWRIARSPDAARAFGAGVAGERYRTQWSPYTRPLPTASR